MLNREFFFVMDRLYETLDQRIESWVTELRPNKKPGVLRKMFGRQDSEQKDLEKDIMLQRLIVAYDLASAFSYMHQNMQVVHPLLELELFASYLGSLRPSNPFPQACLPRYQTREHRIRCKRGRKSV